MFCPTCQGPVPATAAPHRPFCSARCKSIDLARWLEGNYRLPGDPVDPEQFPPPPESSRGGR